MKSPIIILFLIGVAVKVVAQSTPEGNNCAFYKNLKFKNGVDTISIKAVFQDEAEMIKGGKDPIFSTLNKEKKIKTKEFDDQIGFTPIGCTKIYYGPSKVNNPKLLTTALIGQEVFVKCVFFEKKEWEFRGVPFFVIIEVTKAE